MTMHKEYQHLDKMMNMIDDEITVIKALVVRQNDQLKEISKVLKQVQQTVEHDVTHR
jgi:hypothetical protein|tara:strand:+ start:282 stop:452 length:171 start_codon:yes stop_codon:yes gene_type:complete